MHGLTVAAFLASTTSRGFRHDDRVIAVGVAATSSMAGAVVGKGVVTASSVLMSIMLVVIVLMMIVIVIFVIVRIVLMVAMVMPVSVLTFGV